MAKPILLVTASLIGSMDWCLGAPNTMHRERPGVTWKEAAYDDLDYTLLRKPWIQNEAAERGSKFEDAVYKKAALPVAEFSGSEHLRKVVNLVRGGQFQKFFTRDFERPDYIIRVYGILDVWKPDVIIDIKTTANFKRSKYGGIQDEMYRMLAEQFMFKYVVAEWEEYPRIRTVEEIIVPAVPQDQLEEKVLSRAEDFIQFTKDIGRYDLYEQCYCHKGLGWKSEIARKGPRQLQQLEAFYKPFWDKYEQENKTEEF